MHAVKALLARVFSLGNVDACPSWDQSRIFVVLRWPACAMQMLLKMLDDTRKTNDSLTQELMHLKHLADRQAEDIQSRETDLKQQVRSVLLHSWKILPRQCIMQPACLLPFLLANMRPPI